MWLSAVQTDTYIIVLQERERTHLNLAVNEFRPETDVVVLISQLADNCWRDVFPVERAN